MKRVSKRAIIETRLKQTWMSHYGACNLVNSAHADRIIRNIRQNPPVGYVIKERPMVREIAGEKIHYKQFKLETV